ncbi:DUF3310 domain-containing protein [Streptococcus uberis]|uniref:DUF3310 domain-containing protein n=1 Tax=Streptococcus uberis TaxID=1349 RepID=UPI0020C027B0|nr:DUF3310 domain-containing protein [Streptococcus uberis]
MDKKVNKFDSPMDAYAYAFKDSIKNVSHYQGKDGLEVFEVQENFIGDLAGMQAFHWCNVVKYILRFQKKNGIEDLKKARRYLDLMISEVENG